MDDGRSDERDAGLLEVVEGAAAVARLHLDRTRRLGQHLGAESLPHRVEAGLLHAVVGGQPDDDDAVDTAIAQQLLEARLAPFARRQVRDAEARVAVFRSCRFVDDLADDLQVGVQVRAPCLADAVHRPLSSVLGEVRRVGRMPVLRVDHWHARFLGAVDLPVNDGNDLLPVLHIQVAGRVREVVLHVDDEERRAFRVVGMLRCDHGQPPRWKASRFRRVPLSVESNAMAYQSLYRKHRPQNFAGLVGQDHVTVALRNAVREGRVGHAYLYSGPRGTGKTTTARILAKALNCLNLGADGEPCGECQNCVAIAEGRYLDLFELDAASNNSVDNIRDLTDSVHLGLGATSKRKVYLIDEVHMLSAAASNALLKTLEEPPDHVVFVLATTNPEKVLATIRSRTQHLEFTLFTAEELEAVLRQGLALAGVEADPEALAVIARAAGGSARDALSLLDQALAHGADRLDAGAVADLFGGTPFELRAAVLDAVAAQDPAGVLVAVGALLDAGHEPRRIAEDVLRAVRDAFLLNASSGQVRVDAPEDEQRRLDDLGRTLGNTTLVRVLETLGQAVVDMRGTDAADPRLVLEIALVRLTRREVGPPIQTVMERIEKLEETVAGQRAAAAGSGREPPAQASASRAPGVTVGALRKRRPEPASPPPPAAEPEGLSAEATNVVAPPPEESAQGELEQEAPSPSVDVDEVILAWATVL